MNSHSFRSFGDLSHLKSENTVTETRSFSNLFEATTKIYYQDKGYGFLYVTVPEGYQLNFPIKAASVDPQPDAEFTAGETLERPVVIEAFVHGSILYSAGYEMGLEKDQKINVRITSNEKGIQAAYVPKIDGGEPARENNEPRPFNKALAFVNGKVKTFFKDRNFGFAEVTQHPKTGEPLPDGKVLDVYFNRSMLERAGYSVDDIEVGNEIEVRYWTFPSTNKSSVMQFVHKERANRND